MGSAGVEPEKCGVQGQAMRKWDWDWEAEGREASQGKVPDHCGHILVLIGRNWDQDVEGSGGTLNCRTAGFWAPLLS